MSAVSFLDEPFFCRSPIPPIATTSSTSSICGRNLSTTLGRRTTGNKGGLAMFWSRPAGTVQVPTDATLLDVSTSTVWLWGRLRNRPGGARGTCPCPPKRNFTLNRERGPAKSPELPPLPSTAGDATWLLQTARLRAEVECGEATRRCAIWPVLRGSVSRGRDLMKASCLPTCGAVVILRLYHRPRRSLMEPTSCRR